MKRGRRKAGILITACLLTLLCGCNMTEEKTYTAVITKSEESTFWKSVLAGVNTASNEYNVQYTFEGPENEEDYQSQNRMVEHAVEQGADVIVFSAISTEESVETIEAAMDAGVEVVIIDSGIDSERTKYMISTDNVEAGREAGRQVLRQNEDVLNIGVVNFDINSKNGQEREKGLLEVVNADSRVTIIDTIHVESNTDVVAEATKQMIKEHPEINAIVTFNEWTTLGVGYAVQQLQMQDELYVVGFDSNTVSVGMLETGEMDALIVQNPYAMGYLGIEYSYRLTHGIAIEQPEYWTGTMTITKENMYDIESQKILFPIE